MNFPTVPAVQPWTCHPEDYHFTQHLTETQEEQKKGLAKRGDEGDEGKEGADRGKKEDILKEHG